MSWWGPYPARIATCGLGSSNFARHYSQNRFYFLFLRVLRCFSSPGSPHWPMDSVNDTATLLAVSSLIRISADLGSFAAPRSFSQLVTSFFGAMYQGILRMLFVAWSFSSTYPSYYENPKISTRLIVRFETFRLFACTFFRINQLASLSFSLLPFVLFLNFAMQLSIFFPLHQKSAASIDSLNIIPPFQLYVKQKLKVFLKDFKKIPRNAFTLRFAAPLRFVRKIFVFWSAVSLII